MKAISLLRLFICACIFIATDLVAQTSNTPEWAILMYQNEDPQLIIQSYEEYYQSHPFVKNEHTQNYKRWQRSFSRPTQDTHLSIDDISYIEKSIHLSSSKAFDSEWSCIGPINFDKEAASRSYAPGAAHVYTIEACLNTPSTMYAGTATAGLWKSIDGGATWVNVTKNLYINAIYAIEIDPTDPDVVYFGAAGSIYKSIDGGLNWVTIGDPTFNSNDHSITEIALSPANTSILFVASDYGFYKSNDAGSNFTEIMSGEFQEIEFKPNDASVIYTVKVANFKTEFYRSTDNGDSFSASINGWPNPTGIDDHQERTEIAVSPANPLVIYANATGSANGGSGTYGIYKSVDAGLNWTFQCCGSQPAGAPSPTNMNLMGWDKDGQDDGGQYYYDVALEVDPTDANKLHLGGVNHWISLDGGITWNCPAKWSEPGLPGYVHADIHDIRYINGNLWIACDGGAFLSTDNGASFSPSQTGIEGTDFWGFGVSPQSNVMLGGAYHNGTMLKDNDVYTDGWLCTGGGDGIRGYVNFGNDRKVIDDWGGRVLSGDRTVANGSFSFDSLPNGSYIIGESSTIAWDPRNYNQFILGRDTRLIKSIDNGTSFTTIHDFGHKVTSIQQSRADLDVIYVCTYQDWWGTKKVWRTQDGGNSWTDITPTNLNGNTWVPYDIAVSHTDPNEIWVARTSQYSDYPNLNGNQVYHSSDGGSSWTNISTPTIDNEWISNIVHQAGTDGGVYIGTRRAVYYRNNTMNDWQLFNNGLPVLTPSTKLVPMYKENKLYNATSRSAYEVELYEPSAPIAQIAADKFVVNCKNTFVQFVDHSVVDRSSATFSWTFQGGIPATSNEENPLVEYTSPGSYDVSLTVTDANGTSSQSYTAFITYEENETHPDLSEGFDLGLPGNWEHEDGAFNWQTKLVQNGPECTPSEVLWVNHYNISNSGEEVGIITYDIALTEGSSHDLVFDYAYAKYGGSYEDGLRIDASTDCWQTYDTLFLAIGAELETVPTQTDDWEPSNCSDWSAENHIDLSQYSGDTISIRFVAINGYGNNFYLDNVNLMNDLSVDHLNQKVFSIYPNPTDGYLTIKLESTKGHMTILTSEGRKIVEDELIQSISSYQLDLAPGTYFVHVKNEYGEEIKKLIIQ